jgi:hypothetical protein
MGFLGFQSFSQTILMSSRLSLFLIFLWEFAVAAESRILFAGERRLNNLVAELLEVSSISQTNAPFTFTRLTDGWVIVSATCKGPGTVVVTLDGSLRGSPVIVHNAKTGSSDEGMCFVRKGNHAIQVECEGECHVENLSVKAIPELVHCGLGFNSQIKSYGVYDMDFLRSDILPNVTTLIIPSNLQLSNAVVEDWHRQGKRFVAEVGINSQSETAAAHFQYWSSFFDKTPFLDGIIIDEFIVNYPIQPRGAAISKERQERMKREQRQYDVYGEALSRIRADDRYTNKLVYCYVGGSGKKLNQEIIGTNLIHRIMDCGYRVALERYLHEMSTEEGSAVALKAFVDGIADWEAKEPGVKEQMVIAFGLFSMPPGGLNKEPNVDYHVWMDQQMNVVANDPVMARVGGLEWWTSTLADEETVRFVGKLYRHYAIEGKTNMLTKDPLFLTHLQNADFEKGTEGWTLQPAESGTIAVKRFPRFGRIEGRFMGLGRPADPEHIGDAFLWMKRSDRGPNIFSQMIKGLEPGRLYSMKMFSCDYDDLVHPKPKKIEEAQSVGTVLIQDVDMDAKRSFNEVYASNPEPKIPVCITYYWRVFRAKARTAKLTVSDWRNANEPGAAFGQEQAFNFLEVQPYHE